MVPTQVRLTLQKQGTKKYYKKQKYIPPSIMNYSKPHPLLNSVSNDSKFRILNLVYKLSPEGELQSKFPGLTPEAI